MKNKKLIKILFSIYILFLILFVVLKFDGSFERIISLHNSIIENEKDVLRNINLIPFRTMSPYLKNITETYAFKNIAANIVIFIPLGFFISNKNPKNVFKALIICLGVILSIELIQLFFKIGFFDVDDIILNFIGSLLGVFMSLFVRKM
ncbi:VanZ family protein [Fenollaria massiliensis]|uniref:VanZ family protein n=1 Tax=Fenollaria massiliensis TaxID=938288 RepID=A0A9E7DIV9_9FIRM|nr:VanZ family protein [Fenollaria massiliensis]UQK58800.1 VanZ family protein [Fenollaria massiliensis]